MNLRGKVCIVTGGAQGIGRAVCTAILNCMGKVSILDVNEEKGKLFVREVKEHYGPGKALFHYCDVTSKEQMENAFKKTLDTFGDINVVVNNAGIVGQSEDNLTVFDKVIDINLKGVVYGTYLGVRYMGTSSSNGRGKGGVIINVASMSGLLPSIAPPVYSATKYAVVGFTRNLEMLRSTEGIRVNCICPAFADTPLVKPMLQDEKVRTEIEKYGLLSSELIAEGIKQLIEDDSKNGCVMRVTTVKGIDYKMYRRAKL